MIVSPSYLKVICIQTYVNNSKQLCENVNDSNICLLWLSTSAPMDIHLVLVTQYVDVVHVRWKPAKWGEHPAFFSVHVDSYVPLIMTLNAHGPKTDPNKLLTLTLTPTSTITLIIPLTLTPRLNLTLTLNPNPPNYIMTRREVVGNFFSLTGFTTFDLYWRQCLVALYSLYFSPLI